MLNDAIRCRIQKSRKCVKVVKEHCPIILKRQCKEPVDVQIRGNARSAKTASLYILRTGSFVRNSSDTFLRWLVPLSHLDISALRKILVPKRKEVTGGWEKNCIVKKFMRSDVWGQ